jgi:hypothetical protein
MKPTGFLFLSGALLLAGCQEPAGSAGSSRAPFRLNPARSVEITPADDEFARHRSSTETVTRGRRARDSVAQAGMTEGELYALPKFTVTRKGFLNFGLSVVTNTEVTLDGKIEWMRVGVVLPDSPAAREGLFTGIEILAIDGIPVAELNRADMLHALFEREAGEQVRLLVYSRPFGPLPIFVTLGRKTQP